MNVAMAMSVIVLGAVLVQTRAKRQGERGKEKQTADSSPRAARNDNAEKAQTGEPVPQGIAANRVQHRYLQTYKASANRAFAVMEPVEEVQWAPGFEFEWVYAKDGPKAKSGQEGDVFLTRHHSGLGSRGQAIWVISKRDMKERRIQFVRVVPDFEATKIDIDVWPDVSGSKCEIVYTFTALSDHGREHLRGMTQEHFAQEMKEWQEQVESYLARGGR